MKHIPLTQGKYAIVDDEDYENLSQWKWYALKDRNTFYAVRWSKTIVGKRYMIAMHRLIYGAKQKECIDHRNHNGLDNRKENLRLATNQQNQFNQKPRNGQSKYKGVNKCRGKWIAQIRFNYKKIHLGLFQSEEEAAHAYNEAAIKYFGEYANLNATERR